MRIIEKIEIKNFRSFSNRSKTNKQITKIKDLNIFSGSNDSGKSNILRALNLFFNKRTNLEDFLVFENDFFKRVNPDDSDIVEKQITIKIFFWNEKNKGANENNPTFTRLPERFWVSRKWLKNAEFSAYKQVDGVQTFFKSEKKSNWQDFYESDNKNLKKNTRASLSKQLNSYLDLIQYHYVPAIKDIDYFSHLYGELQQTLLKVENSKVNKNKKLFQESIQETTKLLMDEFKSVINTSATNMSAVFELPDLINLFKTLNVQTDSVNLRYRGDGVQAKLIPEILNFIASRELKIKPSRLIKGSKVKKYFIWGFEEPENSYEYKNAQLLADRFKDHFTLNAQIFLTTHSFNFLSIEGIDVSTYRVWKDNAIESTRVTKINRDNEGLFQFEGKNEVEDSDRLNDELGVFQLNSDLEKLFLKNKEKQAQLSRDRLEFNELLLKSNKPVIFFEDEYLQIYKVAFLKLNDHIVTEQNYEKLFNQYSPYDFYAKKGKIELNKILDMVDVSERVNNKIIGIFDYDSAYDQFNGLKSTRWSDILGDDLIGLHKTRKDHENFHSLLLPVPPHRTTYANCTTLKAKSVLEIELYFTDSTLTSLGCCLEQLVPGVTETRKVFGGKKSKFWKLLLNLHKDDFVHFNLLFNKIDSLLDQESNNNQGV